jgi:RNA polymerase sigma-70 factor (ECF subfamily)
MQQSEDQLRTWMLEGLDGTAVSYAALLRALVPLLGSYYRRRLGDTAEVEDLVQETLIAVHTRRMTYDRRRPFTAWLYAIARYKMIDRFRRTRETCPIEKFSDELVLSSFEEEANARIDVDDLLASLPSKQADAIRRTRIDGHSVADAAHATGLGESDVKVSVHRGLKALAARLRGERP